MLTKRRQQRKENHIGEWPCVLNTREAQWGKDKRETEWVLEPKVDKFGSVQLSCSVMSDSATPWMQHTMPPCPAPTPGAYPNSCPLSWWCHLTISPSGVPFSSHLQSWPASRSFQMSQIFTSRGQSIGVSALASVLPMNIQDWCPLGWTGWISLQSKGLSRVFSNIVVQASIFQRSAFFMVQLSHPYMTPGKTIAWLEGPLLAK